MVLNKPTMDKLPAVCLTFKDLNMWHTGNTFYGTLSYYFKVKGLHYIDCKGPPTNYVGAKQRIS